MATEVSQSVRTSFAAIALRGRVAPLAELIEPVRRAEDPEAIHDMRVASRRLRTALTHFADIPPSGKIRKWRRTAKHVTKSLGAVRDLDVQIEFLDGLIAAHGHHGGSIHRGLVQLRTGMAARRRSAQPEVLRRMDELEASRLSSKIEKWAAKVVAPETKPGDLELNDPGLRSAAAAALAPLVNEVLSYAPFVACPDCDEQLHALRIAAKRLRYGCELFAPLYKDKLKAEIRAAKGLQRLLGVVHDCDVWLAMLKAPAIGFPDWWGAERPRGTDSAQEGLAYVQTDRQAARQKAYLQFVEHWQQLERDGRWTEFVGRLATDWGPALDVVEAGQEAADRQRPVLEAVTGDDDGSEGGGGEERAHVADAGDGEERLTALGPLEIPSALDEALRPAFALAEACDYEVAHSQQVTRLAVRLFDELLRDADVDARQREWLAQAALLHDIGWLEGGKQHHKRSLAYILASPILPWDERHRLLVGSIARYHRKALPKLSHDHFAALNEEDQDTVRRLAAWLRVADGLDYGHRSAVAQLACETDSRGIHIQCWTTRPADLETDRAERKADLARQVTEREIHATWRLLTPEKTDRS